MAGRDYVLLSLSLSLLYLFHLGGLIYDTHKMGRAGEGEDNREAFKKENDEEWRKEKREERRQKKWSADKYN